MMIPACVNNGLMLLLTQAGITILFFENQTPSLHSQVLAESGRFCYFSNVLNKNFALAVPAYEISICVSMVGLSVSYPAR